MILDWGAINGVFPWPDGDGVSGKCFAATGTVFFRADYSDPTVRHPYIVKRQYWIGFDEAMGATVRSTLSSEQPYCVRLLSPDLRLTRAEAEGIQDSHVLLVCRPAKEVGKGHIALLKRWYQYSPKSFQDRRVVGAFLAWCEYEKTDTQSG